MRFRSRTLTALLSLPLASVALAGTPSAAIRTAPIQQRVLHETLTVYGKVTANPRDVQTVSALDMGRVTRLQASLGERVAKGQVLLQITPTPQARSAWLKARHALDSARTNLQQTRDLVQQKLATRSDLAQAKQRYQDAEAALQALQQQGSSSGRHPLRAPRAAIVTKVQVQPDAVVQPGQPLLELGDAGHLRVRLGLEPEDASRVKPGLPVTLQTVFGGSSRSIAATVTRVQGMVDPSTRLVDALVDLDGSKTHGLTIGSWLRGRLQVRTVKQLAVPHAAVLSDNQGSYVFVVAKGKAHMVRVKVPLRTPHWTAVSSPALHAGEDVVVSGNYELEDGMAVRPAGSSH